MLSETFVLNTGYAGNPIRLSTLNASLNDPDGSETLAVTVSAIPVGATITDGTNTFTATAGNTTANLTTWNRANLSLIAPSAYTGSFTLTLSARATETLTGQSATQTQNLTVTVLPASVQSPLVLDLDGNGLHTVALEDSRGTFDLLNTGAPVRSGWIDAGDGFLAVDSNANGKIDHLTELFGGKVGEGYAKLRSFDTNRDGQVDASDARFGELRIWQDPNANHRTEAGELNTLAHFGIASISTHYSVQPEQQHGNWLLERGHATRTDGTRIEVADAYFEIKTPNNTHATQQTGSTNQSSEKASATQKTGSPSQSSVLRPQASGMASLLIESKLPAPAWRAAATQWNLEPPLALRGRKEAGEEPRSPFGKTGEHTTLSTQARIRWELEDSAAGDEQEELESQHQQDANKKRKARGQMLSPPVSHLNQPWVEDFLNTRPGSDGAQGFKFTWPEGGGK